MSAQFKVGEVAILQNCVENPELSGSECEVVGLLQPRKVQRNDGSVVELNSYLVHVPGRKRKVCPLPHQLRRKQPPKREIDTVVSWEDCAWKPSKATA